MSPTVSKIIPDRDIAAIIELLLDFLWRQWAQLGVAGDVPFRDTWRIDPEPLLLFTLRLGRFDPRLFDEVLDWCAVNGDWLSIQRLKALLGKKPEAKEEVFSRTVAAFATVLATRAKAHRWRTLIDTVRGAETTIGQEKHISFFRDRNGLPFPLPGREDPDFRAQGLIRAPVEMRGLSQPPPVEGIACRIIQLRALFGVDPRAEVVAYLLTHRTAGAREIARATGYVPATIHTVLARLARGRFISGSGQQGYAINVEQWQTFLGDDDLLSPQSWVEWMRVLPVLATTVEALAEIEPRQSLSPYMQASQWLRLDTNLRDALIGSGLPNPFAIPCSLENINQQFPRRLKDFAFHLKSGAER